MTRPITPHKGGRTITVHARVTPATKTAIDSLTISLGDLIEWAVKAIAAAAEKEVQK
jgi:hypothetical protein